MARSAELVASNPPLDLTRENERLQSASAQAVVEWARARFGDDLILSSSFGAESALMLHLVTRLIPRVRVVFIDTGYLFPETYRFAEELRERFDLDLRVYSPTVSAARQEALYGRLWEGGEAELQRYQALNKVEPMQRALGELAPRAWLAGLRNHQTAYRAGLERVALSDGVVKVHPVLEWSEAEVRDYMRAHDLPYHPLFQQGYRSIGDVHSTEPVEPDAPARSGRKLGVHSECGIHLPRHFYASERAQRPAEPGQDRVVG